MKVLIVDDETMICEWLQFCISQNPTCQIIGIAHNGKEALKLFQQEEADLVLTDIKMPVMNGLELLHALRAMDQKVRVVVLTAFSDFELVRQALRDGASEYLLKAEMQNDSLQILLDRMAHELKTSEGKEEIDRVDLSWEQSIIDRILCQDSELSDIDLMQLRQCGIRWRNNGLFALAVWKRDIESKGLHFPKESKARHVIGFDYTAHIYVIVGNFPRISSTIENVRLLTEYATQVQQINSCMVGISEIVDEMRRIPFMVWQAACSLGESFFCNKKSLYKPQYSASELLQKRQEWKQVISEARVQLLQSQKSMRYEEVHRFLQKAEKERILAVGAIIDLCLDAFDLIEFESRGDNITAEDAAELKKQLNQSISLKEVEQVLEQITQQRWHKFTLIQPKSPNIRMALAYINEHYREQLSLEQVAEQVCLNPDYFSRIFKSETGQTFVNYLTDIRLQHAVQILENTAQQVQTIAQSVGYYNASYFSTTFKKKYGMSPYEYRRRL